MYEDKAGINRALRIAGRVALSAFVLAGCQSSLERATSAQAETQALFASGRYREAATEARAAIKIRDDVPGLWMLLGRSSLALNDYPAAFKAYRNVADLDQSNEEALLMLAQLSLRAGHFADATTFSTQVQSLLPGNIVARTVEAYASFGSGRYADAQAQLATVLEESPQNEQGLVLQSMLAARDGELAKARDILLPAITAGTAGSDTWRAWRRIARRTADTRAFLLATDKLIAGGDRSANLVLERAEALYLLSRDREASAYLNRWRSGTSPIIGADDLWALWFRVGLDPSQLGLSIASTAAPDITLAAAGFALRLRQIATAGRLLDRAHPADPPGIRYKRGLMAWLAILERKHDGELLAERLLASDLTEPDALRARAEAALMKGRGPEALKNARLLIAEVPGDASAYDLLARVYTMQHDRLMADRTIAQLSNDLPNNAEASRFAVAYWSQRDPLRSTKLAQDLTARLPFSRFAWVQRRLFCTMVDRPSCLERADEMLRRLAGAPPERDVIPEQELDAVSAAALISE